MNNARYVVREAKKTHTRPLRLVSEGGFLLGTFQARDISGATKAWLKREGYRTLRDAIVDGWSPKAFRVASSSERAWSYPG